MNNTQRKRDAIPFQFSSTHASVILLTSFLQQIRDHIQATNPLAKPGLAEAGAGPRQDSADLLAKHIYRRKNTVYLSDRPNNLFISARVC